MDRNQQRDKELVALPIAAAFVYRQIMGAPIETADLPEANTILHDVAHAISNVAPIYGTGAAADTPRLLPPLDLIHGAFQRGAAVLRTPAGIEYQKLFVRRADMRMAVTILMRRSRLSQGIHLHRSFVLFEGRRTRRVQNLQLDRTQWRKPGEKRARHPPPQDWRFSRQFHSMEHGMKSSLLGSMGMWPCWRASGARPPQ